MKKIITFLFILLISQSAFSSETIRGENFQRPRLIDCQTYHIESLNGIHNSLDLTSCFYEGYYMRDGKEEKVIIEVKVSPHNQKYSPRVMLK